MRGGHERIWRGNHFARDAQGLQSSNQGNGAVGKQGEMLHTQIFAQRLLQLLVERAAIGKHFAFPYFLQIGDKLFQRRQKGLGDVDGFAVVHIFP